MAPMLQPAQHLSAGSSASGNVVHWGRAKRSHESGRPISKVKGVAVHNAGRIDLDRKDLKFMLWNDDPNRLRRRCASVARPSRSPSPKCSIGFLSAHLSLSA